MRVPFIAGNWKMNMTIAEAVELVNGIQIGLKWPEEVDVVVAPPFTALKMISEVSKDSYIAVSAQNIHQEENGAYTGEIAASFVKDAGATYAIIGHSERRQYFGETDEVVNKKVRVALKHELKPIVCVGETLEQRERGEAERIISRQVEQGLEGTNPSDLIVAYEPIWAIGTGKTCEAEDANKICKLIRKLIGFEDVVIQYGGSVKPNNID